MKKRSIRGKKIMRIFVGIVGVIVTLNILGFVVNSLFFKNELASIEPYGKLVEVEGKKMHVYSMGNGEETVVLLPGLGISLPSADFGPLMRELSDKYTVVTVEYFGVGFSEQTDTPRTNENYVKEIRAALSKAGFSAPYVLMPHSLSGIYVEHYAATYPDEVSAVIMLDTTSSVPISAPAVPRALYSIAKVQQATGFTRLTMGLMPDPKKLENGYTEKERADYKRFNYHVINETFIDQSLSVMDSVREVESLPFPQSVPVLKLISQQSINAMAKRDKDDGMGYQQAHLNRLGATATYKVIDGTHMFYQTKAKEIAVLTQEFLAKVNGN